MFAAGDPADECGVNILFICLYNHNCNFVIEISVSFYCCLSNAIVYAPCLEQTVLFYTLTVEIVRKCLSIFLRIVSMFVLSIV
jgi:hypothetical protein